MADANLLSTPAAPNPQPQPSSQGNPLAAGQNMQTPQAPPQRQMMQMPAPDHAQTVAALRHFHAITQELEALAVDPELGKSDLRDKLIDGATKLVGERIISPSDAVKQLGDFPDVPFQQKAWIYNHLQQAAQASSMVLDHHRLAHAGKGEMPSGNPDNHLQDVKSLMQSHYPGQPNA